MAELKTSTHSLLIIYFSLLIALLGCAPTIKLGKLPNTAALELLKPKFSTKNDVLTVLGEPDGYGKIQHFADVSGQRDTWLYYYTETKGSKSDLKFLQVFMKGEQYDGYLWFSSVKELKKKK